MYCNTSSKIQKHVIKILANELDKETALVLCQAFLLGLNIGTGLDVPH